MFIGLIQEEPQKVERCRDVWRDAEAGKVVIYTSYISWAEVFRMKCDGPESRPLDPKHDEAVENMFRQNFIWPIILDEDISTEARRLMRRHTQCKKPTDAIHLASALSVDIEEMHTYDSADLLHLDGQLVGSNGKSLKICKPYIIPPPPPPPVEPEKPIELNGDLFQQTGS